ncbi:MAG: sensor histidine kinase [Elusimicrobia bacterium]|nr:sensor histidine kinase [Elusimicrobiota bacterium]
MNGKKSFLVRCEKTLERMGALTEDIVYIMSPDYTMALVFGKDSRFFPLKPDGKNKVMFSGVSEKMHRLAHEKALKGEKAAYEWWAQTGRAIKCYHTALLPVYGAGGQVCGVLGIARDVSGFSESERQFRISEEGVKNFSRILLTIREEEKKKIAVSMHDELGSMAVSLTSLLSILEEDIKDGRYPSALEGVRKVSSSVRELIFRLRNIAIGLRPPNLDTVGLSGAIRELIAKITEHSKVNIKFDCRLKDNALDDAVTITLYRVAQETISNGIKHGRARNIKVLLKPCDGQVLLQVGDDGKGFEVERYKFSDNLKHIGLLGMKEGVEHLGGMMKIESGLTKGTVVCVTCPKTSHRKRIWK